MLSCSRVVTVPLEPESPGKADVLDGTFLGSNWCGNERGVVTRPTLWKLNDGRADERGAHADGGDGGGSWRTADYGAALEAREDREILY
jgi:hypothetical protein